MTFRTRLQLVPLLLAVLTLGCATGTSMRGRLRAPPPLVGVRVYVDPEIRIERPPSIPSQQAVIVDRLVIAFEEAFVIAGLSVVNDPSLPHDFVLKITAKKAHTLLSLEDGELIFTRNGQVAGRFRFSEATPDREWAKGAVHNALWSSQMIAAAEALPRTKESPVVATPPAKPAETAATHGQGGLVAVLPLSVVAGELDPAARATLEEAVRTVAGEGLSPAGYTVLNGENTLRILADNNVDASAVCEASCALEAARELKASLFVSTTVMYSEGRYVSFVRLYDAKFGRQLGALQLDAQTVSALRAQLNERGRPFIERGLSRYALME